MLLDDDIIQDILKRVVQHLQHHSGETFSDRMAEQVMEIDLYVRKDRGGEQVKIAKRSVGSKKAEIQLTLFGPADHPLLEEIRQLDLNVTSPLEALRRIEQWQASLFYKPEHLARVVQYLNRVCRR